ncbi:winged helix-turn-helix domain-containing protein [Methanosarcina sp. UBA5]|uniref:winged helix-turn-helix domain-containing protein n=1 Tax=Methanosarcina sp. UBA5 TaxID=1915593 RepID=UPI0025E699A3|nr:winged helix-turn-helix domain-containing protein [Methanosarcina sp. UBA5]
MKTETNKGKILDLLLDSPKTTAELAHELGYVNSEGIARYNVIDKDLKKLVENRYLKSVKVKKEQKSGNTPTLYSINFSIQNLRAMIEDYPFLTSKMKRNDIVLEAIFSECSNFIRSNKYKYEINQNKDEHKRIFCDFSFVIDKEDLKKRSQLSEEFFKLFLINDTDQLAFHTWVLAKTFNENLSTKVCKKESNLNDKIVNSDNKPTKQEINFGLDVVFKACVIKDIVDGRSSIDAIEYLNQIESEVSDETNL